MSTVFSTTSWLCPAISHAANRGAPVPSVCQGVSSQSGARPSWCRHTKTAPSTSRTGSRVRSEDGGGGVPYPVRVQAPSGPKAKRWKGHSSSSPSSAPSPRCAPKCGQYGRTARTSPSRSR